MKAYCTQNNGDCSTCSLVSYGRDCHNEPIGLYLQVKMRIDELDFTQQQQDIIFTDWGEGDDHYRWLLTAERETILDWIAANSG